MEKLNLTCLASVAISGLLLAQAAPAQAQVQVNTSGGTQQAEPAAPPSGQVQVNVPAERQAPAPTPASATVVNNIQTGDSGGSSRRMAGKLMIAGGTLFGATYLATVLGAAITSDVCQADSSLGCRQASWPIYVPIVGPFIQMGYINGTGANTGRAILAIDGALQAGGLAMFIAGAALWGSSSSRPQYARRIQLAPYSAATGSGLVAFGSF
jgi:hypothetical protein